MRKLILTIPAEPARYVVFCCVPDLLIVNAAVAPSSVVRLRFDGSRLPAAVIRRLRGL